jgi:hypothetical protein
MRFQIWSTDGDDHLRPIWEVDAFIEGNSSDVLPLALGDIDGDGDMEAAINMGKVLTVWDWEPDEASPTGGTMVQIYGEHMGPVGWGGIFVEDVDGDGRAEVITHDPAGGARGLARIPELWENPRGTLIRRMRR